jgi:hypothetical protein
MLEYLSCELDSAGTAGPRGTLHYSKQPTFPLHSLPGERITSVYGKPDLIRNVIHTLNWLLAASSAQAHRHSDQGLVYIKTAEFLLKYVESPHCRVNEMIKPNKN